MSLYNLEPYNKKQEKAISAFMQQAEIQIAIEASSALTLKQHLDNNKKCFLINIETFGESAKEADIREKFKLTKEAIMDKIKDLNTN